MIQTFKVNAVNTKLQAINDKFRLDLIKRLKKDNGNISISELAMQVNQSEANVGNHLAKLQEAGLIYPTNGRDKRSTYYVVNTTKVNQLLDIAEKDFYIFYKTHLLSNKIIARILAVINTESLILIEIDKKANVSPTANTGMAFTYLKKLIEAGLVTCNKENGKTYYRSKGTELIKTVNTLKQI